MFVKFVFFNGGGSEVYECDYVERIPAPQGPDISYVIHMKGERADIFCKRITLNDAVDVYYMSETGKTIDRFIHGQVTSDQGMGGPGKLEVAGGHS